MTYPSKKTCVDCKEEKFLKEYSMYKSGNKVYYRTRCKECYPSYKATLPPSTARADLYGDTIVCIKCNREKPKTDFYWNTTSGYINKKCKICFDSNNRLKERIKSKREKAIKAYGGLCVCCNESENIFLTFDHINNDGAKHREDIRPGWSFYKWLEENSYPDTIQILCFNCNWAKHRGGCPHQVRL